MEDVHDSNNDKSYLQIRQRCISDIVDYDSIYWASLVSQLVKNPPAMRETWVRCLGWEDPLEKGKATYSSILAWRIPWAA